MGQFLLTADMILFQTSTNVLSGHVTSTPIATTPSQAISVYAGAATMAMVTRVSVRHPYCMLRLSYIHGDIVAHTHQTCANTLLRLPKAQRCSESPSVNVDILKTNLIYLK